MISYSRSVGLHIMRYKNSFWTFRHFQPLMRDKLTKSAFCVLSKEPYRVIHDRQQRCFTIRLDDGAGTVDCAVLKYTYRTDRHVLLLSTTVPEAFRGKGVASHLAEAALDFVVEKQLKATISCWYIQKYVDENPLHGCQTYIED